MIYYDIFLLALTKLLIKTKLSRPAFPVLHAFLAFPVFPVFHFRLVFLDIHRHLGDPGFLVYPFFLPDLIDFKNFR